MKVTLLLCLLSFLFALMLGRVTGAEGNLDMGPHTLPIPRPPRHETQECTTLWVNDYPSRCATRMRLELCNDQDHGMRYRCTIRGDNGRVSSSGYRTTQDSAVSAADKDWQKRHKDCQINA